MKNHNKQSGFIVLMGMLVIVLGAAVWFGTLGQVRSNTMMIERHDKNIAELHSIKQRMLAYAALHPEIYSDNANIPGPGYFPCPDWDNDGDADTNCGINGSGVNHLFVLGQVPFKIAARNYTFINTLQDRDLFWYAVDARFVNSSARYTFAGLAMTSPRFANLNTDSPNEVQDSLGAMVPPLTVDGKDDVVMVLMYAGDALANQNRAAGPFIYTDFIEQELNGAMVDGQTHDFFSVGPAATFNDYVITITRDEWQAAVLSRVAQDINPADGVVDLCTIPIDEQHWFNECFYVSGGGVPPFTCTSTTVTTEENIVGQNWRAIAC